MNENTVVHGPDRLRVHRLAVDLEEQVHALLKDAQCSAALAAQLRRAAESLVLNIAEGSAHFAAGRRLYHYQTAHASAAECVAAITRLRPRNPQLNIFRARATAEMVSAMLVGLVHSQQNRVRPPTH
jgi:four helix bundle protein